VIVKYGTRRVNDLQAALESNRLQLLCVSRLHCNGTHLHHKDAHAIEDEKKKEKKIIQRRET
jgi:hypothetical protein